MHVLGWRLRLVNLRPGEWGHQKGGLVANSQLQAQDYILHRSASSQKKPIRWGRVFTLFLLRAVWVELAMLLLVVLYIISKHAF